MELQSKLKKHKIIEYEQYRKDLQIRVNRIKLALLSPPSPSPSPSSSLVGGMGGVGANGDHQHAPPFHVQSQPDLSRVEFKRIIASGCDGIVCVGSLPLLPNNSGSGNGNGNGGDFEGRKEVEVAVKVFPNYGVETKDLGKYRNEYAILYDLYSQQQYHPNIIQLYQYLEMIPPDVYFNLFPADLKGLCVHLNGRRRVTSFLVMEYHPVDLQSYLTSNYATLSGFDKLMILFEIGNALYFLYKNHIAHRDIKLNNLLMSSSRHVILCDFGLAIKLDHHPHPHPQNIPPSPSPSSSSSSNNNNNNINNSNNINNNNGGEVENHSVLIPRYGGVGGNPHHLAPEVSACAVTLNDRDLRVNYEKQSTWEFGLLCFEVLFGEFPDQFFSLPPSSSPLSPSSSSSSRLEEHQKGFFTFEYIRSHFNSANPPLFTAIAAASGSPFSGSSKPHFRDCGGVNEERINRLDAFRRNGDAASEFAELMCGMLSYKAQDRLSFPDAFHYLIDFIHFYYANRISYVSS
jgi:serine/threonine protein kinase